MTEEKEQMIKQAFDKAFDKNFGEEIIIDGVNVAGCEHYCEKINTGSGVIQNPLKQGFCLHNITGLQNADIYFRMLTFPKCREQSNCHYKQLMFANKKLEAAKTETEKLVSTIWIMSGEITDLRNEKERLHNELIEAKGEQLGTLIRYNKILERITEYIDSNYGLTTFHIQDIVNIINEAIK